MHQEETASGISVDDMSEIDVLLEELVVKEESLNKVRDAQSRKQKEDNSKAEDIRQKALERYSETKKRESPENGDECEEKPKRQRRSARTEPLVEFMQEKVKRITTTRAGSKKARARAESAGDGDCLTATTTNKSCKPFCRLFKSFFRKKNDIFPKYEHVKSVFICFRKKTGIC